MGTEAISLFPVKRNDLVGELKLQSCEEANIFYAEHIQTDESLVMGDYSIKELWKPAVFSHQPKREEDVVVVDGESTIIQGHFIDRIGESNQQNWEYEITVYVWVEIEEPEIKEKGETK